MIFPILRFQIPKVSWGFSQRNFLLPQKNKVKYRKKPKRKPVLLLLHVVNDDFDFGYASFFKFYNLEGEVLEVNLLVQLGEVALQF